MFFSSPRLLDPVDAIDRNSTDSDFAHSSVQPSLIRHCREV